MVDLTGEEEDKLFFQTYVFVKACQRAFYFYK
jgi:hypothetical protein